MSAPRIRLIVGLGNPGVEYELTRHNIAWLTLDNLSFERDLDWQKKFKGTYSSTTIDGEKIYFLKPLTYMNLSGESAGALAGFFRITAPEILVVHDELDLPFGRLAFKKGGGLAGHNGLRSLAQHFGSPDFLRLRIGIGRPDHGTERDWVLRRFGDNEIPSLEKVLEASAGAVEEAIKNGFEIAAGKFSKRNVLEGPSSGT